MSQIEVTELYPRCRVITGHDETTVDANLSIDEIVEEIKKGYDVGLYVDGWSKPWRCFLDPGKQLRAECPTASKVIPLVVNVSRDGAVFKCDCDCCDCDCAEEKNETS